jgi:hypothetical protein
MSDGEKARRPIFIIGSPRSGTSILTWCIGQHANILVLEETNWIAFLALGARFAHDAGSNRGEHTHLSACGIERESFFAEIGRAVDRIVVQSSEVRLAELRRKGREDPGSLVSDPPQPFAYLRSADDPKERWVDGTPYNSIHSWGIHLFFPEARFVHILRDPRKVVRSLIHFDRAGGTKKNVVAAAENWLNNVTRSALTERALGAGKVLRVHHEDLVADGEGTLRSILAFLDEPFDPNCLLPLGETINSSRVSAKEEIPREFEKHPQLVRAFAFYDELIAGPGVPPQPDSDARAELERLFDGAKFPKS